MANSLKCRQNHDCNELRKSTQSSLRERGLNPKVQSTAGKFTQNVRMTRQLPRSLHARCNQASLRARTAGLPTSANRLQRRDRILSPRGDLRTEPPTEVEGPGGTRLLGGTGGKPDRALLSGACASPRRLNPKDLNPTPESPPTRASSEEIREWESTAREDGVNRHLEGSWGGQTFAKKAKPRASRVPSTTFDTGTRVLADANTELTVRA